MASTGRRGTSEGDSTALDLAVVVARTGVPSATLHHWLSLGLLPAPIRLARNRFAYDERHVQAVDSGQGIDDFFRQAVTEIFVLGIGAHVGKRQHRDRGQLFHG